jgi:GNAT superfamily N-acetyltransferase
MLVPLSKLVNTFNSYLYPNRALDPSTLNLLTSSLPFSAHYWSEDRSENWYLGLCAIHPSHQGGGFGRELVEWGIREADNEGVHASVMSSEGNDGFYLRCGFDEIVGNATEGAGNPLAGVKGGNILFRWPRSQKSEMVADR